MSDIQFNIKKCDAEKDAILQMQTETFVLFSNNNSRAAYQVFFTLIIIKHFLGERVLEN